MTLRTEKTRSKTVHEQPPLHVLLPAVFLILGALTGYFLALRCADPCGVELRRYLDAYARLPASPLSMRVVLGTLACYFRAPLAAFLLGYASVGIFLIPPLCAVSALSASFSLCSFALALGRGGLSTLLVLFALRLALVLPCLLSLSGDALARSYALRRAASGAQRTQGDRSGALYRFFVCCVLLLLGALAELWLLVRYFA